MAPSGAILRLGAVRDCAGRGGGPRLAEPAEPDMLWSLEKLLGRSNAEPSRGRRRLLGLFPGEPIGGANDVWWPVFSAAGLARDNGVC